MRESAASSVGPEFALPCLAAKAEYGPGTVKPPLSTGTKDRLRPAPSTRERMAGTLNSGAARRARIPLLRMSIASSVAQRRRSNAIIVCAEDQTCTARGLSYR